MEEENRKATADKKKKVKNGCIGSIFMHADGVDMWLMGAGFIGGVADGSVAPLIMAECFTILVDLYEVLTACGRWVGSLLDGFCWTRTGERQATRMRTRYLKAVLRQEVGYFDLNMTNTAEVVTGIAYDCFTIQEVLSEKVPTLITRGVTFIGTCIAAFLILWRLAIVFFPFLSAAASYFNIWKSFTVLQGRLWWT
ncbi:hypothetical protein Godav_011082 [Gossypium davidsonii]|uniref:ABC transmembrane type-1 domain-containing protein n=2 Tax=Gossypium TaxID=3633 RepID=A0A7J8R8V7_GOSDV|nr:hypothetical protein [Gossypium davidsonii]MBA0645271.1 hypothetical protein [Gossypium klotzschianum]